jgi:hypothetical protein
MYINSCLKEHQYDIDVEKYPHTHIRDVRGDLYYLYPIFPGFHVPYLWLPVVAIYMCLALHPRNDN